MEPKERRRRRIPRRVTQIAAAERTPLENRAIRAEIRRTERLLDQTQRAVVSRILRPLEQTYTRMLFLRDNDPIAFRNSGGMQELQNASQHLERERQRVLREYIRPLHNYSFFWQNQFNGEQPPRPPPPPPPGLGFLNIRDRRLS